MEPAVKPRKRIVPQLIQPSPTKVPDLLDADDLAPPSPQLQVTDLREQAEFAKEHLGLDRKIYVDLKPYQESGKSINWKQLLRDRGVKPAGKMQAKGPEDVPGGDMELMSRGRNNRQNTNPLLRVLKRLEQTYNMRNESDEESENSEDDEDGSSSGSDSDDEGGNATDGGARTDAEAGPDGAPRPKRKKKAGDKGDDYDYADDWIDDDEFVDMIERSDKRKTRHTGFFISRGEIERTDELLPDFAPDKERPKKAAGAAGAGAAAKRKPGEGGDSGSDFQHAPPAKPRKEGGGGGGDGEKKAAKRRADAEGGEPPKKKKKKIAPEALVPGAAPPQAAPAAKAAPKPPTMAQLAAMSGAMASAVARDGLSTSPDHRQHNPPASVPATPAEKPSASMPPPPPSTKRAASEPYEVRREVAAAITSLREVAALHPPPPEPPAAAEGEDGGGKKKRQMPAPIGAAVKQFSALYCQEVERNSGAASRLLDDLLSFLEPFTSRANLGSILRKSKAEKAAPTSQSLEGLRKMLAGIPPVPLPPPAAAGNSDDDFQEPPSASQMSQQQPAQQPEQGQQPAGTSGQAVPAGQPASSSGGAGGPALLADAWKRVPQAQRSSIYEFMRGQLGSDNAPLNSSACRQAVQSVYNAFPAGSITVEGVQKIYTTQRKKALAAAASAGQAAKPSDSGAPSQAALAQPKKAASRPVSRQPSPVPNSISPEAFADSALKSAAARLTEVMGAEEVAAMQAEIEAAKAAAAAAAQPAQPAGQLAPVAAAPAFPAPAAAAAAPSQPAAEELVPLMTDEEVVQAGVRHGADADELHAVLRSTRSSAYSAGLARVLMVVGPTGATVAEVLAKANELRFARWEEKANNVGVSRSTGKDFVARLSSAGREGGKYTLRAFPGVVHVPKPAPAPKALKATSAPPEDNGGGAGSPAAPAPAAVPATQAAALEPSVAPQDPAAAAAFQGPA